MFSTIVSYSTQQCSACYFVNINCLYPLQWHHLKIRPVLRGVLGVQDTLALLSHQAHPSQLEDLHTGTNKIIYSWLPAAQFSNHSDSCITLLQSCDKCYGYALFKLILKCPYYGLWKVHILVLGVSNNRLTCMQCQKIYACLICIYFDLICSTTSKWFVQRLIFPSPSFRFTVLVAQWLEHCVSSAKVVGSIPMEHTYWQYKCISWMHCKSLWIKASAKCKSCL